MQKAINIAGGVGWGVGGLLILTLKFYILKQASSLTMFFQFQDIFASTQMKGAVHISGKNTNYKKDPGFG